MTLKITTFLFSFIAYLVTIPLFIIWLLFCAVLSLIGLILSSKQISINLDGVKKKETICRVLNEKGLLSDEDYSFETNEVAYQYDELIFRGYLFVLSPIIFLLKHSNFMDRFILYLVYKWMEIHHLRKDSNHMSNTFFAVLMKICVFAAGAVGRVLYNFSSEESMSS